MFSSSCTTAQLFKEPARPAHEAVHVLCPHPQTTKELWRTICHQIPLETPPTCPELFGAKNSGCVRPTCATSSTQLAQLNRAVFHKHEGKSRNLCVWLSNTRQSPISVRSAGNPDVEVAHENVGFFEKYERDVSVRSWTNARATIKTGCQPPPR